PALVPAFGGDPVAARRRPGRGRLQAARALVSGRDVRRLWPPDGGGRAGGAGEGGLADREGSVLVTGSCWVTHADRARWQQQAAGELAAILDEGAGLPLIAWTVAAAGASLAGQVTGAGARAAFAAWRQALALDAVLQTAV